MDILWGYMRCQGRTAMQMGQRTLEDDCTDCMRRTHVPDGVKFFPVVPKSRPCASRLEPDDYEGACE